MIELRGETLFAPCVCRRRIRPANIATDDWAGFMQLSQCPPKITDREPTVLPICRRFFCAEAIKIDSDVDIFVGEVVRKSLKIIAPIFAEDGAFASLIFDRPIVCPGMYFKNAGTLGATVPENLVRPPTFKISAAPDRHVLDVRKFECPIDPAAASPFRRAHIPIRMIVE